ncbi:MAG: hypothetical protein E7474_06130 [Ruminococcaceae bacterium]|nr:hypothetical protein [Oscillospiraceae bacterium]
MAESRVRNAERNTASAFLFQIINLALKFALRTVFIHMLGKEYLGVSGVFSNIFTVLSLSDLGLRSAIVYDMYKPISEGNEKQICSLVNFYKVLFTGIGLFVLSVGLLLIPFLDKIINSVPNVKSIVLIYILLLSGSVLSYFYAPYSSLIGAYQKNYVITNINIGISFLKTVLEVVLLIIFKSYIIYLLADIALLLLQNVIIRYKAIKMYRFIKEKADRLNVEERIKIFKNAVSNFSIRISFVIIEGTDNILISMLVSTILVGLYSNYAMIVQICVTSTTLLMHAVLPGVGNICVSDNYEKRRQIFHRLGFIFATIYALIAVGYITTIDLFIEIWAGKDYILPFEIEIIIIFNCWMSGMRQTSEIIVSADGLFDHFKVVPLVAALLNIALSIILGKTMGIKGVLLGTTLSQLITNTWYYPYVVCKYATNERFLKYLLLYLKSALLVIIAAIGSKAAAVRFAQTEAVAGLGLLIVDVIFAVLSFCVIWLLFYRKTNEFAYYRNYVLTKARTVMAKR